MTDTDLITRLRSRIQALENRVKELEIENATLLSSRLCLCSKQMHVGQDLCPQEPSGFNGAMEIKSPTSVIHPKDKKETSNWLSSGFGVHLGHDSSPCRLPELAVSDQSINENLALNKGEGMHYDSIVDRVDNNEVINQVIEVGTSHCMNYEKDEHHIKNSKNLTTDRCSRLRCSVKRFVALKVMYFGQRFYGFASEATTNPTVESEIFRALQKTKLITGKKDELSYSRCGRTDKGVSAVGQVIAIYLRSNVTDHEKHEGTGELDYVKMLNKVLPQDIRVLGWSPAPLNFHARFGCLSREYKYFFWRGDLDVSVLVFDPSAMEVAGRKLIGEHDFRNFCKMDALNVHNYCRRILSFEIGPCNERFYNNELWAIRIKGTAFLWHQVRCIVSVLFMIGKHLESPSVVDALLDINETPRKPQYKMAAELPLVLHYAEFENLNFSCSTDAREALIEQLTNSFHTYVLQAAIFQEALETLSTLDVNTPPDKRKKESHIPIKSRPTEPSYEERRTRFAMKLDSKKLTSLPC